MHDATRRRFLALTGAGTAAGAAAVALPTAASASPTGAGDPALPGDAAGSLAAYVHDVRSGAVVLMVDGHEVTVHDPALVARLAHAYRAVDGASA